MKTDAHREAGVVQDLPASDQQSGTIRLPCQHSRANALELFIPRSAQALIKSWKRESERGDEACYPLTVGPRVLGSELSLNLICWEFSGYRKGPGLSPCPLLCWSRLQVSFLCRAFSFLIAIIQLHHDYILHLYRA